MQPPPLPGKASENPPQPPIDQIQAFLDLYYISWFRINRTYNLWAQCHGIQDSTMFLLDEIHRNPEYCTQSMLIEKVLLPKQTVSSALKKLEEEGIGRDVMVTVVPSLAAVGFTVTVPFSVSPMVIL